MKKGDIILVKGTGFVSDIIEDIENSAYSHAAGIIGDNEIIEAEGFQITGYQKLDKYAGHTDVYTCNILTDKQRIKIIEYVENQIGSHYNWILLLLEILRYLFNVSISYKNFNSYICSTLWSDAYKSVGIDLCPRIKYPSPKDLSESKILKKIASI